MWTRRSGWQQIIHTTQEEPHDPIIPIDPVTLPVRRVAIAGVKLVEVRISHLTYASEIAQAMQPTAHQRSPIPRRARPPTRRT